MSGIIWNLLSTLIGGAIGGGGSKVIKNLPASTTTNTLSGALGGLLTSFLGSGTMDTSSLLSSVVGGLGAPAIINILLKVLASKK